MDAFDRDHLNELLADRRGPRLSLYLPTHRAGDETSQDPIRLKNLLPRAREALAASGLRAPKAEEFLEPAERLLRDDYFWRHQGEGLAVFLAPSFFRSFRLPLSFPEKLALGPRFHLKPLLPLVSLDIPYYVLAISRKGPRFLRCTRLTATPLDLPGAPRDFDDVLRFDDKAGDLPVRTRAAAPGFGGRQGWRSAAVHGQGDEREGPKEELRRYCDQIALGVDAALAGSRGPVVLAGDASALALYREAAGGNADFFDDIVRANPAELRDEELRDLAGAIVETRRRAALAGAAEMFRNVKASGQSSADLREILSAAQDGRVLTLFLAVDEDRRGRFDPVTRELSFDGDDDLLDRAAQRTLERGGAVYAVPRAEMPEDVPLAALFRY
jgi:hypothetical protein